MLSILGFIFFFILFTWLIYRFTRRQTVSLSATELTLAFGFKVLSGCLYGYIFLHYYGGDDTWWFHRESVDEYNELFNDPALFFGDFSPGPSFAHADSFFQGLTLYLNNLEKQLTFKPLALFNIFSRGNYYINVIFFNFIIFWAHYQLFAWLAKEFPGRRTALLLLLFFFPPVIFWLSGIRTDGWIFLFTVLLLFHVHRWLQHANKRSLLFSLLALTGLLIFRNMVAILLMPAILAWVITVKAKTRPVITFIAVYAICVLVFFLSALLPGKLNMPAAVVNRQHDYFLLEANTRFALDTLQPSASGFARIAPQAFQNTFLRPYIWEATGILQQVSALDILFFWLVFLLFLAGKREMMSRYIKNPLILVFSCFSISMYLVIGFTVPFPGAIVRYKVIAELLLLITFFINIKWSKYTLYKKSIF